MNRIFIEAKKEDTSECNFLKSVIDRFFPEIDVKFVCMDGVGNLFSEVVANQMAQAAVDGDGVIVLLDADTAEKGYGFAVRTEDINRKKKENGMDFPLFLYPDNLHDGDVETLMEEIARKDLHTKWWDCFDDYEKCISGVKDESGKYRYISPNLKAKLHAFISSQQLTNRERHLIGSGRWLFDNTDFWDLSRPALSPLVDFLALHLK